MVPVRVSVPVPDFVSDPVPMVIDPTEEVPALSISRLMFADVNPPDMVNVDPESICTSEASDETVMRPEITFVPLVLRIAPTSAKDTVTPLPVMVIASAIVIPFDTDSVASFATVVAAAVVPSAVSLLIATTPVSIEVAPVYVLAADSVNVLLANVFFVNVPEPEMIPDNV